MKKAILGTKLGMSQIFMADGTVIPVTVVVAGPCAVTQKKTVEKDGYDAIQVAYGDIKAQNVNKPLKGQFDKAGVAPARYLREFRFEDCSAYEVGSVLKCDQFKAGDKIDVVGTSKGHGYSGVIQRWNAHRIGPMTHGTGPIHRSVGSMGPSSSPSRVLKNKKMAGQWGHEQVTIQGLTIAKVDEARNLILVKGGIPGAKGSLVVIKDSLKA